MFNKSYYEALEYAVNLAPDISAATKFIEWAEDICQLLAFIYSKDYGTVTEELFDAVKEAQEYEDDSEDQDED